MLTFRRREGPHQDDDEELSEDRQVALFLMGLVMFSPLVLSLMDDPALVIAGIPALYVFLFAVWAALIGAMAFVVENAQHHRLPADGDDTRPLL